MRKPINQCDGCMRGLPLNVIGVHEDSGRPIMGCTADRYSNPPLPSALAGVTPGELMALADELHSIYTLMLGECFKTDARRQRVYKAIVILRALADTIEKTEGKP